MCKVCVVKSRRGTDIFINGLLHLRLKGKIVGVHAWIKSSKFPRYFIEYNVGKVVIRTKYVKASLWKEILKQLK